MIGETYCPVGIVGGTTPWEGAPLRGFGKVRQAAPANVTTGGAQVLTYPFFGATDSSSNGLVADVLSTQTANLTIIKAAQVPQYTTWKLYFTKFTCAVLGGTAWTASAGNNPGINIQDTSGNGLLSIPISALQPWAVYDFSGSEFATPFYFGSGTSFTLQSVTATTAVFSSATFTTTTLQGVWLRVIAGTGAGTSTKIVSNTATTLTLASGFSGTIDTTSIFAVDYWAVNGSPSTTSWTTLNASFPAGGNQYVMGVVGTSVNEVAPIKTSSSSAITGAFAVQTAAVAGDLIRVTSNPALGGIVNFGVGYNNSVLAPGAGLVAALQGTISAGSPVRLYFEGYAAP